jgi:hypothetical protein
MRRNLPFRQELLGLSVSDGFGSTMTVRNGYGDGGVN